MCARVCVPLALDKYNHKSSNSVSDISMASSDSEDARFLSKNLERLCHESFDGKSILVTGGTGSFGKAFIRKVINEFSVKRVVVFSRDELKQSLMQNDFPVSKYPCMRYFLGDVRDVERLRRAFKGIDIIIHAAALKQVPALEYNPTEAIKTNVIGAMNIITAAIECRLHRLLAISTDKATKLISNE